MVAALWDTNAMAHLLPLEKVSKAIVLGVILIEINYIVGCPNELRFNI